MPHNVTLASKFMVPPFSILDTRQSYWQSRRLLWLQLGIRSELGREDHVGAFSRAKRFESYGGHNKVNAVSIFDPVLCEIIYRWFVPYGGRVIDPFCGGSVRGIVAAVCACSYVGIDLGRAQVEENRKQWEEMCGKYPEMLPLQKPSWLVGDSSDLLDVVDTKGGFDFIFSCPPYFNLEKYSDDKRDLSNLPDYNAFLYFYGNIISLCADKLLDNRFACFVVSNFRDGSSGIFHDFTGDTIRAFADSGLGLYNEATLLNRTGTAAIRASHFFPKTRKLMRLHQTVLVFIKGDPKAAVQLLEESWANKSTFVSSAKSTQHLMF